MPFLVMLEGAIRFAWSQHAEPDLMRKEGLPACPFRAVIVMPVPLLARLMGRVLVLKAFKPVREMKTACGLALLKN